jgi:hypothetical protein
VVKELFDKWLEGLRSGKFIQGNGALRRSVDNSYCCIGVLGEVSGKCKWGEPGQDHEIIETGYRFSNYVVTLPKELEVSDIYIEEEDGGITLASKLIDLNDSLEWSFHEIADWLEANEGLIVTDE